jgi:hypothetical protein
MRKQLFVAALVFGLVGISSAGYDKAAAPSGVAEYTSFADLKWEKILPELGDSSPERAIIKIDEKTKVTTLYIRTPKKIHVKRHWHSNNERNTIVKGNWTFTCDRCGKNMTQGPGDANFMPAKCVHEAWAPEGGLDLITVDGAFDLNWSDGPSTSKDLNIDPPAADGKDSERK